MNDVTHGTFVSPATDRITIRRITGPLALGKKQVGPTRTCQVCDSPVISPELLERHSRRCALGGGNAFMHAGMVKNHEGILKKCPKATIAKEMRGLRGSSNLSRP